MQRHHPDDLKRIFSQLASTAIRLKLSALVVQNL
jgi:hypothetical protein